jgi:hypothetical protein
LTIISHNSSLESLFSQDLSSLWPFIACSRGRSLAVQSTFDRRAQSTLIVHKPCCCATSNSAVSVEHKVGIMAIELARAQTLPKPWGVMDLSPWSNARHDGNAIGEIWYQRAAGATDDPSLLLKLLFTSQPLSIQVHPDDAFAHAMGMARGKTEAWYVLSAAPGARIALGLKQRLDLDSRRMAGGVAA